MDKIRDQETCMRTKSGFAQNLSVDEIKKQLVDNVASKSNIATEYIKHIQVVEKERTASETAKDESRHDPENKLYF